MATELPHPSFWLVLTALMMAAASFPWAALARRILASRLRNPASGEMLAGLAAAGPLLILALYSASAGRAQDAFSTGSGAAMTYLLLAPAVLGPAAGRNTGAWRIWRSTVLPFMLAASAMWFIAALVDQLTYLHGQFFITVFVLGTWLFSLRQPAAGPPGAAATLRAGQVASHNQRPALGSPPVEPDAAAKAFQTRRPTKSAWLTAGTVVLAAVLTAAGLWGLPAWSSPPGLYWLPLLGGLTCLGPIILAAAGPARRSGRGAAGHDPAERSRWLAALGYAGMAAFALVPGLAGFLQIGRTSLPPYGPYGVMVALAAAYLLGLAPVGPRAGRRARLATVAIWGLWAAWITASAWPR